MPTVLCITCGKLLGHLYPQVERLRTQGYSDASITQQLPLSSGCCLQRAINTVSTEPVTKKFDLVEEEKLLNMPMGFVAPDGSFKPFDPNFVPIVVNDGT
jgi:DNA-directed RNA polymerase subunit N (RpoN/RPB10)